MSENGVFCCDRARVVGDLDGDGNDDLAIGTEEFSGKRKGTGAVHLLFGPVTGALTLSDADVTRYGSKTYDYAGLFVESAGDVDNDGLGDLLVSAEGSDVAAYDAGAVYVVYGKDL